MLQTLPDGVVKAPAGAVVSLVLMLVVVALLTVGWRLAVGRRFTAHRWVQTTAVVIGAAVSLTWMVRSLTRNVLPHIPARLGQSAYFTAVLHAVIGAAATALGVYVVLAASRLLPEGLSFRRFRPVMRTSYALYLAGALSGVILYVIAYVGL